MRIPRGFSEELRNQADILRVIGDYVSLKKAGNSYKACCPFHNEKTPSFNVNPTKGFFKCFGCGKGGDAITFVMEIEGAPFPEAVKIVAEKCGIAIPVVADDQKDYEERDRQRADLMQINSWATEFFEQNLTETTEGRRALAYLEQRGVTEATQKQFHLGYAPSSWEAMGNFLRSRGASRTQIERSGLVSLKEAGGFYDRFRGRLMFPICDTQGKTVAFGGRIIGEGEPKYLNSPETAVYTKGQHLFGLSYSRDSIRKRDYAILVEGYMDFLIPFQAGIRNLVATLGTALTENQVRLLWRYTRQIVVNFDPDAAGMAATKRSLELLLGEGFNVKVTTLPDNLDPDEFIRAHGAEGYLQRERRESELFVDYQSRQGESDKDMYSVMVRQLRTSKPLLDRLLEDAIAKHDRDKPGGIRQIIDEILPYLRLVNDRIVRMEHFARIADRLKIDNAVIREEFKKAVETRQEKVSARAVIASMEVKPAERKLLEILLACQPVRRQISSKMTEEDYFGLRTEKLFHLIFEFERQQMEMSYPKLSQSLDDEELIRELLPQLMTTSTDFGASDQDILTKAEREAEEILHSLRCGKLAEKQSALQAELNQAQRENNTARLGELMMLKFELAKQEKELARRNGK